MRQSGTVRGKTWAGVLTFLALAGCRGPTTRRTTSPTTSAATAVSLLAVIRWERSGAVMAITP